MLIQAINFYHPLYIPCYYRLPRRQKCVHVLNQCELDYIEPPLYRLLSEKIEIYRYITCGSGLGWG